MRRFLCLLNGFTNFALGGYYKDEMQEQAVDLGIIAPIVNHRKSKLIKKQDPATKRWYLDQSRIIWKPREQLLPDIGESRLLFFVANVVVCVKITCFCVVWIFNKEWFATPARLEDKQ